MVTLLSFFIYLSLIIILIFYSIFKQDLIKSILKSSTFRKLIPLYEKSIVFFTSFILIVILSIMVAADASSPFFVILFLILELALFLFVWFVWGREPKIDYNVIYERDVPYNYSPSIVSALINQDSRKPDQEAFIAEILNLCLKRHLKLEKIQNHKKIFEKSHDFKITILKKNIKSLAPQEIAVLNFLKSVADKNELTLSGLKNFIELGIPDVRTWFNEWQNTVKEEAEKMKFFEGNTAKITFIALTVLSGIIITSISSSYEKEFVALILAVIGAIFGFLLMYLLPQALPKRTQKGTLHYEKWMRLKKFIEEFSSIKNLSFDAIGMWEKFYVYAIPLGVADEVRGAIDFIGTHEESMGSVLFSRTFKGKNYGLFLSEYKRSADETLKQVS